MTTMEIIAATDGSDPGTAAVRWAAREAARQRRQLRIIHAFEWESAEVRFDGGYEFVETGQQFAEAIVAAAVDEARRAAPTIRIRSETLVGRPALIRRSHESRLVIVGSHDHGALANAMLGSTGTQLLHHAGCPVYIARPHLEHVVG